MEMKGERTLEGDKGVDYTTDKGLIRPDETTRDDVKRVLTTDEISKKVGCGIL